MNKSQLVKGIAGAGFAFFLIKGLVWLGIAAVAVFAAL